LALPPFEAKRPQALGLRSFCFKWRAQAASYRTFFIENPYYNVNAIKELIAA
jgi:hypothetical protein